MLQFDGQKLRYFRLKAKLNQKELAKKCGGNLSNTDIYKYETGTIRTPSPERVQLLAKNVGAKPEDLMTDPALAAKADTPEKRALAALLALDPEARKRVLMALEVICDMGLDKKE